jgi:hypothetical protein
VSDVFDALLGLTAESEGTAAQAYLTSYPGLGQVIRAGSEAGLSGRQILAGYREAGGTVTDANYWRLRSAVLSATQAPFGQDYAALLTGGEVTEMPGGRAGLHQVNFRQYVQHSPDTGLPEYSVQNFSMSQRELDVADAARAMSDMMDSWDNPADAYGRLIGFEITSVIRYTG